MALLGQSSGGWTESSSALRILYVGVRNSIGVISNDSFTQTNPPTLAAGTSTSSGFDSSVLGVMSGSVAFARPDAGSNFIGGPNTAAASAALQQPLGVFLNNAAGLAYTNTPAVASGKNPYVSSQGSYANSLYETASVTTGGSYTAAGQALTYTTGMPLMSSPNGYLMPAIDGAGTTLINTNLDICGTAVNTLVPNPSGGILGVLKMPADTTQAEIVYDQRI